MKHIDYNQILANDETNIEIELDERFHDNIVTTVGFEVAGVDTLGPQGEEIRFWWNPVFLFLRHEGEKLTDDCVPALRELVVAKGWLTQAEADTLDMDESGMQNDNFAAFLYERIESWTYGECLGNDVVAVGASRPHTPKPSIDPLAAVNDYIARNTDAHDPV